MHLRQSKSHSIHPKAVTRLHLRKRHVTSGAPRGRKPPLRSAIPDSPRMQPHSVVGAARGSGFMVQGSWFRVLTALIKPHFVVGCGDTPSNRTLLCCDKTVGYGDTPSTPFNINTPYPTTVVGVTRLKAPPPIRDPGLAEDDTALCCVVWRYKTALCCGVWRYKTSLCCGVWRHGIKLHSVVL